MCLERVDRVYKGTSRIIRIRYKVFQLRENTGELYPAYGFPVYSLPKDTWLDEELYRVPGSKNTIDGADGEYPMGWHVFTKVDDAKLFALLRYEDEDEVIYRVQCKCRLAGGVDALDRKVEVYRYIKIEKEV